MNEQKSTLRFKRDNKTTWALLATNLSIIIWTLLGDLNLLTVIWIYWSQSIVIGCFGFLKVWRVGKNSPLVRYFSIPFALHYLFINIAFVPFLLILSLGSPRWIINDIPRQLIYEKPDPLVVIIAGLFFFTNHLYSYLFHKRNNDASKPVRALFTPYGRILPVFIAISTFPWILGKTQFVIVLFEVLKTVADLIGHKLEHRNNDIINT